MDELLEVRKNELEKIISKKEKGESEYYTKKLEKVRKCRSSIKNIFRYCPEVEYMDDVDKENFDSVKNMAIKHLEKFAVDEERYREIDLKIAYKELELLEKFSSIQEKESLEVSKSPYSTSFYLHKRGEVIDWGGKPEGSYRLSNHWNFNGHCESDEIGENEIAIGRYELGKYRKVN